jgi:hypothetical protein
MEGATPTQFLSDCRLSTHELFWRYHPSNVWESFTHGFNYSLKQKINSTLAAGGNLATLSFTFTDASPDGTERIVYAIDFATGKRVRITECDDDCGHRPAVHNQEHRWDLWFKKREAQRQAEYDKFIENMVGIQEAPPPAEAQLWPVQKIEAVVDAVELLPIECFVCTETYADDGSDATVIYECLHIACKSCLTKALAEITPAGCPKCGKLYTYQDLATIAELCAQE